MSNKTYDFLVYIAQIVLPAIAAFYLTFCDIWGLPYGVQVAATVTAVDTLLGSVLLIESKKYHKKIGQ